MKNMDLKKNVLDLLNSSGGYKEYYSRYFKKDENKDIWKVKCPFHFDHDPSLTVNTINGLYCCFGCGAKGDIFKFRMKKENLEFSECLKIFAEELKIKVYRTKKSNNQIVSKEENYNARGKSTLELPEKESDLITSNGQNITIVAENKKDINSISNNISQIDINKEVELFDKIRLFSNNLFSESGRTALEFLNSKRGLNNDTLNKYFIGYDPKINAITIPYFDESGKEVLTVKYFAYDFRTGEKKITTYGKANIFGLYNFLQEYPKSNQVIITEGEFDALLMNQLGFLAVSGSSGAGTWNEEWSKYFKEKNVIVCYDSDDAGERGALKVIKSLTKYTKSLKNVLLFNEKNNKELKDISDYFLKTEKTSQNYKDLLNKIADIKIKPEGISDEGYFDLKTEEDMQEINSSQDFVNGKLYYTVKIKNELYLLNSHRKCISLKEGAKNGIISGIHDIDTFRFSREGILNFLEDKNNPNPADLFNKIMDYIQRFIFLQDIKSYFFLSLWTIGTYVFKVFRYYPYVHLNAEKGSGKTLLMEVLAPLCYNGQISCNSSEAVIYRDIQNNSLTLFLDEVERLNKEDKDKYNAIMSILKTGFSKSGLVKRCGGKNKDKIIKFSTYSPKMFAGIKDLDDVLLDRAIRIPMVRKLDSESIERYSECESILKFQNDIRDLLYSFGLLYAQEISEIYNELIEDIDGLEHLNNRELDIWLPIILLANLVDKYQKSCIPSAKKTMIEYSNEMIQYKKENDLLKNDTVVLLNVLNNLLEEVEAHKEFSNQKIYFTETVYEYFKKQDEFEWINSKVWLSKLLKKLNIKISVQKIFGKSQKIYIIDTKNLKMLSQRYNVQQEATLALNSP